MTKKLVLAVIDGLKPAMLERTVAAGQAPNLARIMREGAYSDACAAVFPSVTPACAASIVTGVGPDRHLIPSMNWFSRAEHRYVEYGSSFAASRAFGVARGLNDLIYNMNARHLSPDVETVFETLDDAGFRTAGTTYLMYRGRHRHEVAKDTAITKYAASKLLRHAIYGPQELFYADIFASRTTGCRGQLGLPGARDPHTGCVGEYLVEHDLFDFLLFSLPDNDTYSHKNGPPAQVTSIAVADKQIGRLFEAGGGADAFLEDHAMIVVADHSHAPVEARLDLREAFAEWNVLPPSAPTETDAEIALCLAQRSAMVYVLDEERRGELTVKAAAEALALEGVDVVMHRSGEEGVVRTQRGELRFRPGGELTDPRGEGWSVDGELAALGGRVRDGVLETPDYPDALTRVWSALTCATAGDVLISAAPGWEFADWGGRDHVGGGSHGSLHAVDSLGALLWCGTGPARADARAQWSIRDMAPMVREHFLG